MREEEREMPARKTWRKQKVRHIEQKKGKKEKAPRQHRDEEKQVNIRVSGTNIN